MRRPLETEVVAQGRAFVVPPEQAARHKDRHNLMISAM
jgi:hypothetical protein